MRRASLVRLRHSAHYLGLLRDLGALLDRGDADAAAAALDEDWEQIKLGQQVAARLDPALAFAYASMGFALIDRRRPAAEVIDWLEPAVRFSGTVDDPMIRAELLNLRGALRYRLSDHAAAGRDLTDALALADRQAEQDPVMRAGILRNLALVRHAQGDTPAAIAGTQEALDLVRGHGRPQDESALLGNLGMYADETEAYEQALAYYEEALGIARETGDEANLADWTGNIGNTLASLGRIDEARRATLEALRLEQRRGDRRGESLRLGNLAGLELTAGRLDAAAELRQRAFDIAAEMGDARGQAAQIHGLGQIDAEAKRWEAAERNFVRAERMFGEAGDERARSTAVKARRQVIRRRREQEARALVGQVDAGAGGPARSRLEQLLVQSRAEGDDLLVSFLLGCLGHTAQVEDRLDLALEHFTEAVAVAERLGHRVLIADLSQQTAVLHHERGEFELALSWYRRALENWDDSMDARAHGLTLANFGGLRAMTGDPAGAIASYADAVDVLFRAGAAETEQVRGAFSALLTPMGSAAVGEALLWVLNHRSEVAAVAVLMADGVMMRGSRAVISLAAEPELAFADDRGGLYHVDVHEISGLAAVDGAGHPTLFGQHPPPGR
ncbi:tetratricopeptide repeat protein [Actinoplanes sp. NPDC026623]|uniref:tetratricopeptide repeat protein n=1 Tax=Actinoplanes sp. NPDC026623 TaxID=3155610 RepID=UPI0033D9BBBC